MRPKTTFLGSTMVVGTAQVVHATGPTTAGHGAVAYTAKATAATVARPRVIMTY